MKSVTKVKPCIKGEKEFSIFKLIYMYKKGNHQGFLPHVKQKHDNYKGIM